MKKEEAIAILKKQIEKFRAVQNNDYLNLHYQNQSYLTDFFGKDSFGKDSVEVKHLENLYVYNFDINPYIDYLEICCDTINTKGIFNSKKNIISNLNNLEVLGYVIAIIIFTFSMGYGFNEIFTNNKCNRIEQELKAAKEKITLLEGKIKTIPIKK